MKTRVIIDCDAGSDDAQAILMALAHKDDVTVVAVTTIVGNSSVENTSRNALRVLKFANRLDVGRYWNFVVY